jgi:hypothetical protein
MLRYECSHLANNGSQLRNFIRTSAFVDDKEESMNVAGLDFTNKVPISGFVFERSYEDLLLKNPIGFMLRTVPSDPF